MTIWRIGGDGSFTDGGRENVLDFGGVLAEGLLSAGRRVDFGSELVGSREVLGLLEVVFDTFEQRFDHIPVTGSVVA